MRYDGYISDAPGAKKRAGQDRGGLMTEAEAKRLVAESGRMLLDEGLAARTWGNVSCRTGADTIVITPSGLGYENMAPNDIVAVNMATGEWSGGHRPSSELAVHLAAYRAFPEAGFVIHTHQVYASAIGLAPELTLPLAAEERAALGGVGLAAYGLPGTETLARNVARAFGEGAHAVLMAHHGAAIAGRDRDEAFRRAKLLEDVCRRACEGRPEAAPDLDAAPARRLTDAAASAFGHAAYTDAAPVLLCAADGGAVPAQLDDMAQMIGPRLCVAKPEERAVLRALRRRAAVLVPGVGAVCRADSAGDCRALCLLIEKTCVCRLHTEALGIGGRLSRRDVWAMRRVYLKKYSKRIGG